MFRRVRVLLLTSLLLLASGLQWQPSFAQPGKERYFVETGHYVTGEFLRFYENTEKADLLFGNPVVEAFVDPTTKDIIQYFERARFELDPEAPVELRVRLTLLGEYLYQPGPQVSYPNTFPACRSFPETDKQVCYGFLEFFNENGGVAIFGYPMSNLEIHNGRLVQYFQRTRFEWYPELPPGEQVRLANVGLEYFYVRGEAKSRLDPVPNNNLMQTIVRLQVKAFPLHAVTGQNGQQSIFVIVQDQNYQRIANARVKLQITLPSGENAVLETEPTNKEGITIYRFDFKSHSNGIAQVVVTATAAQPETGGEKTLEQQTVTSFRIWW